MASPLGHVAVALVLGEALRPTVVPRRYWILGACCSLLPDLDLLVPAVAGQRVDALLGGHRGLTHSIPFGLLVGFIVVLVAFAGPDSRGHRGRLWLYFSSATASHGLVDSLTDYGQGIAVLAPFSWTTVKAPWQPLGHGRCSSVLDCLARGLGGEFLWLAMPALLVGGAIAWSRRRASR